MSVRLVDLRTRRHKKTVRDMFSETVYMVEGLSREIAGYAIVIWADDGTAAMTYKIGGIVEEGGIPIYAHQKLNALVERNRKK